MGGKRTRLKRRTLPRRWVAGGLDRLDRSAPEVQALILGAQQIIEDRGGEQVASLLAQRAAYRVQHLDLLLARDELRLAQGQEIDRVAYLNGCASWLRYATQLGLERKARPVQSLASILAEYQQPKQDAQPSEPAK